MDTKLVSAIITTHNRVQLLQRAIESVLTQTYKNIECIVVDDSSTDDTKALCGKYPIHYIYIPKEESHGGNYARNIGIKLSKGEYCAFLDDDDYWLEDKIKKQVELLEQTDSILVYCGRILECVDKDKNVTYGELFPRKYNRGEMSKKILLSICTTTSCILVKRDALIKVGCFDECLNFWQEYEMTIRLAQIGKFEFTREKLCIYRKDVSDKNRLTNKYYEWINSVRYIYETHKKKYDNLNCLDKLYVRKTFYGDASGRAKRCGLKLIYLRNKMIYLLNAYTAKFLELSGLYRL